MIERTAPNGTIIQFPDGTPEETINQYLELDEYKATEPVPVVRPEDNNVVQQDRDRSFLTDIPLQIVGGARDSIQSSINLIEGIGDTLGIGDPNEFDLFELPEIDAPDTAVGGLVRGVSQFATGFVGVGNKESTNITVASSVKVIVFEKAGTSMNQYINNVTGNDNGVLGTYSSPSGTTRSRIGSQAHSSGSDSLVANIKEIVIYNSDIASDRSTIQSELATHYGITLS